MKQASKLTIFGDGGSRGNPGQSAYGFAVFDENDQLLYSEGGRLGIGTNNYAEYSAVINALKWVLANSKGVSSIHFKLDSLLVASQMSGKYKVKHPEIRKLYITAKSLIDGLQAQIIFSHVPRAENKVADSLVNDALDFKI